MADFPAWAWSKTKAAKSPEYKAAVDHWLKLKAQYKSLSVGIVGFKFGAQAKQIVEAARKAEATGKAAWDQYQVAEKAQKLADKAARKAEGGGGLLDIFSPKQTAPAAPDVMTTQIQPVTATITTGSGGTSPLLLIGGGVLVLGLGGAAVWYYLKHRG